MQECSKCVSDSRETEKIVPGRQQSLHRAIIDTSVANSVARQFLPAKDGFPGCSFLSLFDEFHFDWNVEVAFVVSVAKKFADSRTSDLAIIASKFVYVHSDEFAGELRVHVACI